jgi:AcrR family transcriptional regulator
VSARAAGGKPGAPATGRGERTRRRLLEAAEEVFAGQGFHEASIVKITERAGVAQGTFYLYFSSKQQIFEELVEDLNRRVRHTLAAAVAGAPSRKEAERAGLIAYLRFTAERPSLYRIIHQADIVSPAAMRRHYERMAEPYAKGLSQAMGDGEIAPADPDVEAWALMAIAEMIGRRWVLWGESAPVPEEVVAETIRFIWRGLGGGEDPAP